MKVTVWDVTNGKCNVRDYMGVDEETGHIFVDGLKLDTVLIDKSAEWDELKRKNEIYREAFDRIKHSNETSDSLHEHAARIIRIIDWVNMNE